MCRVEGGEEKNLEFYGGAVAKMSGASALSSSTVKPMQTTQVPNGYNQLHSRLCQNANIPN